MITVRNLTKRHRSGKTALNGVSFQVDEGECIAVIGGSGSGKTTLLNCLYFKESWDQGQFIYKGNDISKANSWDKLRLRMKWAFLRDKPLLNDNATAFRNVMAGRLSGLPIWRWLFGSLSSEERMTAMDALEHVGLLDKVHTKAGKLSGGEKQRVALARALVKGAKLILADEPITGLDPKSAEKVMEDFRAICDKQKVTVILTMNNVEVAEKYASRIWGLSEGKIVVDVTGRRLTQREKNLIFNG